jgi:hypothetical protein
MHPTRIAELLQPRNLTICTAIDPDPSIPCRPANGWHTLNATDKVKGEVMDRTTFFYG